MIATSADIDIQDVATGVVATLNSLESYLTTVMNPNRVALADLGMEAMGWTAHAYSPKAFEIWLKQQKLDPNDHLTLHHLAIMHHARAFDLEMGQNPAEADEDWKMALNYWHRLHGGDAFWNHLAAKACSGATSRKGVDELRADLPRLLLGIHYDIALDAETRSKRKARAKFHIALAQNSPFGAEARSAAEAAAYAKFIKAIPDAVWSRNELQEEVVAEGTKIIEEFLLFDPGCQPALEDALRLQRRIQQARNIKWRALDENDPERTRILEAEKKDYEYWRSYFKQLVEMRERLSEYVRENVAGWYFTCGDSLSAYEKYEDAAKCFELAVLACSDEDDRKKYQRRLILSLAYVARAKAAGRADDARIYCDGVHVRGDLTVLACLFLAQAYLLLFNGVSEDDFNLLDLAEELCQRGLAIEPDFDDLQAEEYKGHIKSFLEILARNRVAAQIRAFLNQAQAAMAAHRLQEALSPHNQAERMAKSENVLPKFNSIYILRCQAHAGLRNFTAARKDAKTVADLAESEQDRRAVEQLNEMIEEGEAATAINGLLQQAKQAMEQGQFSDALAPLNEAAKKAPKNDVIFFLRCQAHAGLRNFTAARKDAQTMADLAESDQDRRTAQQLNQMIEQGEAAVAINGLLQQAKQAMDQGHFADALRPLNEAARKAPRNDMVFFLRAQVHVAMGEITAAQQDAQTVSNLAETDEDRRAAQSLNQMITQRQAGAATKRLLDQAKAAMENRQFGEALRSLDRAAVMAPDTIWVFFLRAQARAGSGDMPGALEDALRVQELADSNEERQAAQRLMDALIAANR